MTTPPNGQASNPLRHAPLLLVSFVVLTPLVWMVGASLKSGAEYAAHPETLLPAEPRWENYQEALGAISFWQALGNTLVLCVGSVAGTLVSCSMAAYAFALLSWRGRDWVFGPRDRHDAACRGRRP